MSGFKSMSKLARYGLAVIAVVSMTAAAQNVVEISSCMDLQKIGRDEGYPLSGSYALAGDINMSDECLDTDYEFSGATDKLGWTPIGKSTVRYSTALLPEGFERDPIPDDNTLFDSAFTGTFDGGGYTIRGLYVNRQWPMIGGIAFSVVSGGLFGSLDGATIKNLTIEADTVAVTDGGLRTIGVGILAGFSRNSAITGVNVAGTVAAYLQSPNNNEDFSINAGGLIGKSEWDNISKSGSAVTLISDRSTFSGVIIYFDKVIAGGLVGASERSTISESRSTVAMKGELGTAGGLVGENSGGVIAKSGAKLTTEGSVRRFVNMGGLAGVSNTVIGSPCPECSYWGPLGRITESYATVKIGILAADVWNNWTAGGLVGSNTGAIADCYATGSITRMDTVTAIPPPDPRNLLNKSLSDSDINFIAGGLVGRANDSVNGSIERSYAAVQLSLTWSNVNIKIGGLAGYRYTNPDIAEPAVEGFPFTTSYWDTKLAGTASMGGLGMTTEEMYQQSTFYDWNFAGIWKIDEESSYPYFQWQNGHPAPISWNGGTRPAGKNKLAPAVTVRGKTINIKTSSASDMHVRLIDMKGRTVTRFNATGGAANFSASKISAGRYLVDMKDMKTGKRFTSAVILR